MLMFLNFRVTFMQQSIRKQQFAEATNHYFLSYQGQSFKF